MGAGDVSVLADAGLVGGTWDTLGADGQCGPPSSPPQVVHALAGIRCDRRVIISGTPLQNELSELHSLVTFVNPGLLGSKEAFRNLYADCISRSREPSATSRERDLGRHTRPPATPHYPRGPCSLHDPDPDS